LAVKILKVWKALSIELIVFFQPGSFRH